MRSLLQTRQSFAPGVPWRCGAGPRASEPTASSEMGIGFGRVRAGLLQLHGRKPSASPRCPPQSGQMSSSLTSAIARDVSGGSVRCQWLVGCDVCLGRGVDGSVGVWCGDWKKGVRDDG